MDFDNFYKRPYDSKFVRITNDLYIGNFDEVPSRSGQATVILMLANSDNGPLLMMKYCHHEDSDLEIGSPQKIIAQWKENYASQLLMDNPDWADGIQLLINEIKRVCTDYFTGPYELVSCEYPDLPKV